MCTGISNVNNYCHSNDGIKPELLLLSIKVTSNNTMMRTRIIVTYNVTHSGRILISTVPRAPVVVG